MDLESMNTEYINLQKNLEDTNEDIKDLENMAVLLGYDMDIWKGKLAQAKKSNDTHDQKIAEEEIEILNEKIQAIIDDVTQKKIGINVIQTKINEKIEELKQDPEMKKHLNEVMTKKYSRQIDKLEKEKETLNNEKDKLTEKKDRFAELQTLINDHASLKNNLKGFIIAKKEIKEINKEIEKINEDYKAGIMVSADKRKELGDKLKDAQSKMLTNKNPLMAYITKNGLNITEQDIDELSEIDFNGNLDVSKQINAKMNLIDSEVKGKDRAMKSKDKAIANYDIALNNRDNDFEKLDEVDMPEFKPLKLEDFPEPVANKPKWYQFIKKFKNWVGRKKQVKEVEIADIEKKEEVVEPTPKKTSNFRDSLKYTIVQDILKKSMDEDLKQAKQERKNNQNVR